MISLGKKRKRKYTISVDVVLEKTLGSSLAVPNLTFQGRRISCSENEGVRAILQPLTALWSGLIQSPVFKLTRCQERDLAVVYHFLL